MHSYFPGGSTGFGGTMRGTWLSRLGVGLFGAGGREGWLDIFHLFVVGLIGTRILPRRKRALNAKPLQGRQKFETPAMRQADRKGKYP